MNFDIHKDYPWLKAQLSESGYSNIDAASELCAIAHGNETKDSDNIITWSEFRARCHSPYVSRATAQYLTIFFQNHLTRESSQLKSLDGEVLEEVRIFDNNSYFETQPAVYHCLFRPELKYKPDVIARRVGPSGEWEDITQHVRTVADRLLAQLYDFDEASQSFCLKTEPISFETLTNLPYDEESELPLEPARDEKEQKAWEDLDITNGLSTMALITLYRLFRAEIYRGKGLIPDSLALSSIVNIGEIRSITDTVPVSRHHRKKKMSEHQASFAIRAVEKKLASDMLLGLQADLKNKSSNPRTYQDQLSLIAIHNNHMLNITKGEYGLDILKNWSSYDWELILSDKESALAVSSSLADAITAQDRVQPPSIAFKKELIGLLLQSEEQTKPWFKMVIATAILLSQKNNPHFFNSPAQKLFKTDAEKQAFAEYAIHLQSAPEDTTIGELVFHQLDHLHEPIDGKIYQHDAIVHLILSTLGDLSNSRRLADKLRQRAFDWCATYYNRFKSFVDKDNDSSTELERHKHEDRRAILKTQRVMPALFPKQAQTFFAKDALKALDTEINPRTDKNLAHNAYYKHIGDAETLAYLRGQPCQASNIRLDQENNDLGRMAENTIRKNEVARLEFLKEAHLSIDPQARDAIKEIMATFDPKGILMRNLAVVHVLRYIYTQRDIYDPATFTDRDFSTDYVESLSLPYALQTDIDLSLYERDSQGFDNWLMDVQEKNPYFFTKFLDRFRRTPTNELKLPTDVIFIEVNEVEVYQYYLDPDLAPEAILDFVGAIRSWTSGYHGRVLTRMQAFFDQDTIRKDKKQNPDSYKRPDEYYDHYKATMSRKRFDKTVLPILHEAEEPSGDKDLNLSTHEAHKILDYFKDTGFAAYLPQWVTFLIQHRFKTENGNEDLSVMHKGFELLTAIKFPKDVMRTFFEEQGFLKNPQDVAKNEQERQRAVQLRAESCLKKLPSRTKSVSYEEEDTTLIRKKIWRAGQKKKAFKPQAFAKLKEKFEQDKVVPGDYFDYRRESRRLLKAHDRESIQTILDEALSDKEVIFPANSPLAPLSTIAGWLINNDQFEKALFNIATSSSNKGKGIGAIINFSQILVQWAEFNNIDLTSAFTEAFANLQTPDHIKKLQDAVLTADAEIDALEKQIVTVKMQNHRLPADQVVALGAATFGAVSNADLTVLLNKRSELAEKKKKAEHDRNEAIVNLGKDPKLVSKQVLFQLLASIYNSIRRQYLKEVLISGGDITGRLVESYLEQELIPRKQELIANSHELKQEDWVKAKSDVDKRISFLMDVLAEMETVER